MKKVLKFLSMIFLIPFMICFTFTGCDLVFNNNYNINDGFDEEVYEEPEYTFDIAATEDQMVMTIKNVGSYGETASIQALLPDEYLPSESNTGLSDLRFNTPYFVDTYECGTEQEFTFNREVPYNTRIGGSVAESWSTVIEPVNPYTDGIYLKYYIISDSTGEILAGPKYCTEIEPVYKYDDPIPTTNIKGVMCEGSTAYIDYITDMGCSYVNLNMTTNGMFIANELVDESNGYRQPLDWVESVDANGIMSIHSNAINQTYNNVEYIDFNGQRFYFNVDAFAVYDATIKAYNERNIKVTLVILNYSILYGRQYPFYMYYSGLLYATPVGPFIQPNTANTMGLNYWGAFLEFLGRRYSETTPDGALKHGFVEGFIMGNEVDFAQEWNAIVPAGHAALSFEQYMEEYERYIRLSNQALKKYYAGHTPLVSITHNWTTSLEQREYCPKNILDYMASKSLKEGNYNWGIALHPYGASLPNPLYWRNDLSNQGEARGINGSLNTGKITFTNIETLQLYLEQPTKLCNGKIRDVHITEGGVCGPTDDSYDGLGEEYQAAGIAYAYYKVSQLSCIKSYQYYRLKDHWAETAAGLYTGILGGYYDDINDTVKKKGYYVWKYIDTEYSFAVANDFIKYMTWSLGGTSYGYGLHGVTDWQGLMTILPSKFDWTTHWDVDKIITRTGVEAPTDVPWNVDY